MTELHGEGRGGGVSEALAEHRPETPVESRGAIGGPEEEPSLCLSPLPPQAANGAGGKREGRNTDAASPALLPASGSGGR